MWQFLSYLNYCYHLKKDSAAQSSLMGNVTELIYLNLHTFLPNMVILIISRVLKSTT